MIPKTFLYENNAFGKIIKILINHPKMEETTDIWVQQFVIVTKQTNFSF
jgi:hypothetical protein